MDFGKLTTHELSNVDFSLPADSPENKNILNNNQSKEKKFFVGCAKWGRKDWIGKFYPEGTKEKDFLSYYAKLFNCIELNATFYKVPDKAQTKRWKENVGVDFKFCPKFPQVITHMKRMKNCERDVDLFLEAMYELGNNLGPVFLMPHPQTSPKHIDTLTRFISSLPKDIDLFLELRHPDWYINGLNKDIFNFAKENKIGFVITDAAGRRDCVHMHVSKPETFIRFVGNSLDKTDYTRTDDWVQRIKTWLDEGLQTLYYFMHQHEELHSPELIKYFAEQMNERIGLKIPVPHLLNENKAPKLFE